MTPETLRTVADYHQGHDLVARLAHVDEIMASKNDALRHAADEIERLTARVQELERAATHPNT